MWQMYASKFNKCHKKDKNKNKNKKVRLHMLTHGAMWACGLTSLMVYINDNFHDIREKHDNKEWELNYEDPFPKISGY
jgi:hypothetical protein